MQAARQGISRYHHSGPAYLDLRESLSELKIDTSILHHTVRSVVSQTEAKEHKSI